MTEQAKRVAAFCERVITYQRIINALRQQEYGTKEDAEQAGVPPDLIYEQIRERKKKYCGLWATAKNQVYDLVTSTGLDAKQARVIDLRYRKSFTWAQIQKAMRYDSIRSVHNQRDKAFERMALTLDRLFPDWQIGDA